MSLLFDGLSEPRHAPGVRVPDPAKAELLRSLGRLVRGLSALFWGLPAALILDVQIAETDWLEIFGPFAIVLPLLATGLILFGLIQLGHFQKQERVWIRAVDRAQLLVFVNLGLVPFLYWWHHLPLVPLYSGAVSLLAFCSLLFLFHLNHLLERLTAMLPDETLRLEARLFTSFNRALLILLGVIVTLYVSLDAVNHLPQWTARFLGQMKAMGRWFAVFLLLMPLAMTMAMIWKIKEVIFASLFDADR